MWVYFYIDQVHEKMKKMRGMFTWLSNTKLILPIMITNMPIKNKFNGN